MRVRGVRSCNECETEWSYFDTGSIVCPQCGSIASVGLGDRRLHTDAPVRLELPIESIDDPTTIEDVADIIERRCRRYRNRRGFIRGGELRRLDDQFLLAHELLEIAADHRRQGRSSPRSDAALGYDLSILDAVIRNGRPPDPDEVPRERHRHRGLGHSLALGSYLRDLKAWLETNEGTDDGPRVLIGEIEEHLRRIEALEGDVEPREVDGLVHAVRAIRRHVLAEGRSNDRDHVASLLDELDRGLV